MARPVKSADQMSAAWLQGMQAAGPKWADSINQLTVSPTAQAAKNLNKYVANTAAAVSSGRMAAALNAVSLADYQSACSGKQNNLAQGAQLKQANFTAVASRIQTAAQQVRDAVTSMPKGGSANAAARSAKAVAIMKSAFGKKD